MKPALLICAAGCVWAQPAIEPPAIGQVLDASGSLRPVWGVAGSFVTGPSTAAEVLSAACSQRLCLAKTASSIVSPAGQSDAPPGAALFGFEGSGATVYFPESRIFARWLDDALDPLDWIVDGEVLSIRTRAASVEIAVRREGQVWIVRPDGAVLDGIGPAAGPVLLLAEGILFASENELILRRADASETRFELTGAEAISQMGDHYAAIRAGDATWLLRTDPGREQLFLLPGSVP